MVDDSQLNHVSCVAERSTGQSAYHSMKIKDRYTFRQSSHDSFGSCLCNNFGHCHLAILSPAALSYISLCLPLRCRI